MKSCPEAEWKILCDVFATCVGLVQMREGQAPPTGVEITSAACMIQPYKSSENRTMPEILGIWHDVITWPL